MDSILGIHSQPFFDSHDFETFAQAGFFLPDTFDPPTEGPVGDGPGIITRKSSSTKCIRYAKYDKL